MPAENYYYSWEPTLDNFLRDSDTPGIGDLMFYGEIGVSPLTAVDLDNAVQKAKERYDGVRLRIHSGGGDMDEGAAMIAILEERGELTLDTKLDGICMSMTVPFWCMGRNISISGMGLIMVHKPWMLMGGDADDFARCIIRMDHWQAEYADFLAANTAVSSQEWSRMMDEETWLRPQQALDLGLVNEVMGPGDAMDEERINNLHKAGSDPELKAKVLMQLGRRHPVNAGKPVPRLIKAEQRRDPAVKPKPKPQLNLNNEMKHLDAIRNAFGNQDLSEDQVAAEVVKLRHELNQAKARAEEGRKREVINKAIQEKRIVASGAEDLLQLPLENLESYLAKFPPRPDFSEIKGNQSDPIEKDLEYYLKNDPEQLGRIQASDPAKYKLMFDAYKAKKKGDR